MNNKTCFKAVLLLSIIASLVAGAFLSIGLLSNSDDSGLNAYKSDNIGYFNLVCWVFVACCVVYALCCFTVGKRIPKTVDFSGRLSKIAYGILGVSCVGLAVFNFVREFTMVKPTANFGAAPKNYYVLLEYDGAGKTSVSFLFLAFTAALITTAVYFLYMAFSKKTVGGNGALLSLLPALAIVLKTVYDFLLQSGGGYGGLYNYHLLALGFVLLFAVGEARFHLGKGIPQMYAFYGLVGASASIVFSIPVIVVYLNGSAGAEWHPVYCIIDLAIAVYIYIRLFSLNVREFVKRKKKSVIVQAFEDEAEEDTGLITD